MKVSRAQAEQNREKVIDAASRLFRAQGIDGVGIGAIMASTGLTHGGFYNQFASKDALAAEACARALAGSADRWRALLASAEAGKGLAAIATDYLSGRNRDAPETGCALASLGPDAARHGGALAARFSAGMDALADLLEQASPDAGRAGALATLAQLTGAMVLARAVPDPALSDAILAAARRALWS